MKRLTMFLPFAMLVIVLLGSCGDNADTSSTNNNDSTMKKGISQADWGEADGKKVYLYTLTNSKGTEVKITNYGGTITSWVTADKSGAKSSIVLGFDNLAGYQANSPYFGATIGRYGNRIADAKFSLDGKTYKLAANNGKNHLHGGLKGFDKVVWDAQPLTDSIASLTLKYLSNDGEEGYPGNLNVAVTFTLSDNDELKIDYAADTDKTTVLNLTNHSYFNLTGSTDNTILDHQVFIDADRFTPVDTTLIPTGELKAVAGTVFDFKAPTKIGLRIDSVPGGEPRGYDHNWVLNKTDKSLSLVATAFDSLSGRKLEVYTMEPGLQFYTGNFLDGTIKNTAGKAINKHTAFCFETQHFPDSPNQPSFPSVVLKPGEKYATTTTYKVSTLP